MKESSVPLFVGGMVWFPLNNAVGVGNVLRQLRSSAASNQLPLNGASHRMWVERAPTARAANVPMLIEIG